MKRIIALLLAVLMLLSLAACGETPTAKQDEAAQDGAAEPVNGEAAQDDNAGIEVDEGLLFVDVTIPASFFEDKTAEEIKAAAEEEGYNGCTINEDGSVTYSMTKNKHKQVLDTCKDGIDEVIASFLEGEEKVASFVAIEYNDDVSQFDVYVDASAYSMWDNLYALSFYMLGGYYQAFAGIAADEMEVVVNFIDNETKEVLDTGSYKEFAQNTETETQADAEQTAASQTDAIALAAKQTVTIEDVCEFAVDYSNITADVVPPQPGDWYSHYAAENGKVYVDICLSYKNLATTDQAADEAMSATLVYGGKYQYTGFSMIEEENRSDFTYSNITGIAPLSTEYLHYLFEVPAEIETGNGALVALISIDNTQYSFVVREGTEGEVAALNENAVAKTSGSVKDGEIIAVMNTCEFFVDFSAITDSVTPPQPADWYTYYEAESGKVYVDFCIGYKNWKTKDVGADDVISATLTYADKYEYTGFSTIEENNRGDFTYTNITSIAPLCTEYVHYLFELPAEAASGSEPIEISFTIGGNSYTYTVR